MVRFRCSVRSAFAVAAALACAQGNGPLPELYGISRTSNGYGNGRSEGSSPSLDGSAVAFHSAANNLGPEDTNGYPDVYVRKGDGTIVRVSQGTSGESDGYSVWPSISGSGKQVAFLSQAGNLTPDDKGCPQDVFYRDLETGQTRLVSVSATGAQSPVACYGPAISRDGRYVAFYTDGGGLLDGVSSGVQHVYRWDSTDGSLALVSTGPNGPANGSSVEPKMSADGRYVVFDSIADNLVPSDVNLEYDVFRKDMVTGAVEAVSVGPAGLANDGCFQPFVSGDGRFVVFSSEAGNLVDSPATGGTEQLYLKDLDTQLISLVSIGTLGVQGNALSWLGQVSDSGRFVVFESYASNLVTGDTNDVADTFLVDRGLGKTIRMSQFEGIQGLEGAFRPSISPNGKVAFFDTSSSHLAGGDTNGWLQVLAKPVVTTTIRLVMTRTQSVGGESNTVTVSLSAPAPVGGVTVFLTTNRPALAWPALGQIVIQEGARAKKVVVKTSKPTVPSAVATIFGKSDWGNSQASLTVLAPLGLRVSPASVKAGEKSTLTISLGKPAPSGGMEVALSTDDALVAWPALSKVVLPEGTRAKNVQVRTGKAGTAKVSGISPVGSAQLTLTVK